MSRSAIVAGLALSTGLLVAPAQAQTRMMLQYGVPYSQRPYDDRDGSGRGYYGAYRFGYGRGYEDGFDHGKDDAEDRDGYNFWHHKEYRNADDGYRGHYGPKWDYQRGYRGGYEVAYRRAYMHFQRRHDHDRCDARYWSRELPRYDDRWRDRDGRYDDREDWRDRDDWYDRYDR